MVKFIIDTGATFVHCRLWQ